MAIIIEHRTNLRDSNLADTETDPPKREVPKGFDNMGWRPADGSFNDLGQPWMGGKMWLDDRRRTDDAPVRPFRRYP